MDREGPRGRWGLTPGSVLSILGVADEDSEDDRLDDSSLTHERLGGKVRLNIVLAPTPLYDDCNTVD